MTKVKTLVMFDDRYLTSTDATLTEIWLNESLGYKRYKVIVCKFPVTEVGLIRVLEVGEKEI